MELRAPRWLVCAGLAAVPTAVLCAIVWPGLMSFDSLLAWQQAGGGITTGHWPPMHAYAMALAQWLHVGLGGLLVFQVFGLFFGAFLVLDATEPRAGRAVLAIAIFLLGFALVPPLTGTLIVHWRDALTATFACLGLAAWVAGSARDRLWPSLVALLLFALIAALRLNGLALAAPLMIGVVVKPSLRGPASRPRRAALAAAGAVALAAAIASLHWRLPDFKVLENHGSATATQEFDLVGISACAGAPYLPAAASGGRALTAADLAAVYDPREFLNTIAPSPGKPRIYWIDADPTTPEFADAGAPRDAAAQVAAGWRRAILAEPVCYLTHRLRVFSELIGLIPRGIYYPTNAGIDENPYGLRLAHPAAAARLSETIETESRFLGRPAWLYLIGAALLVAALRRDLRLGWLLGPLAAAVTLYLASLFIGAPGAGARYAFPANALCLLGLTLAGAALARSIVTRPRRAAPDPIDRERSAAS
jgi:hypothetical protein